MNILKKAILISKDVKYSNLLKKKILDNKNKKYLFDNNLFTKNLKKL